MGQTKLTEKQFTYLVGKELVNQCLNLNTLAELDTDIAISMIQDRLDQKNAIAYYIVHSPTVEFMFNKEMLEIVSLLREGGSHGTHH